MPLDPKKRGDQKGFDQEFLRIIDEFGWHVMSVAPRKDEEGDLFSYSTGLYYHFQHAEIIVFNQRTDLRHNMVNNIGNRVKAGEKFEPGKGYSDIIGDFDVQFRPLHSSRYWGLVNFSCWFYDNDETSFPLLQCFYPDMAGKFPWDPGCEQWAIDNQPQLDQPKTITTDDK
ncbi:MAG TPA: DUF4262 domain-containing protein [Candidatus Angelobacter sp.]|nr:DUF4262 domain-containing protein [Candidatus Angelobacter sp.]